MLLRAHGRGGGWITAVLRDGDGIRLLGMRPVYERTLCPCSGHSSACSSSA